MENRSILQWAEEDRPREKLLLKGKSSLTDAELLAILIGSGTRSMSAVDLARWVLKQNQDDLNILAKTNVKELTKIKGIGEAKAIAIVSAMELGRRRKENGSTQTQTITTSLSAYESIRPYLQDLAHEEFWVLLLNRANQVIRPMQISSGGVAGTVVDPKIIFNHALSHLACSMILVHNHPSGSLKPSQEDLKITKKLQEAGKVLEISILDHLILGNESYFSFSDESLL